MRPSRLACAATIIAIPFALAHAARAEEKSAPALRAQALFEEGRLLMNGENYAAACPKFAESQELDPAPGTILNLAVCHERANKLASAWAEFRTAEATAQAVGQKARADLARKKSEALELRLSRLTLNVRMDAQIYGLEIRCNGEGVRPTDWGVAIPHDGGAYVLEATAAGRETWKRTIELNASGETMELAVPVLQPAPAPPPPPKAVAPAPVALLPLEKPLTAIDQIETTIDVQNRLPTRVVSRGGGQRTVGIAIGAAGIVTMGVAVAVGAAGKSKFDTANGESGPPRHDDSTFAVKTGDVGTVVGGVGAIVSLVGAGVWLSAPKDTTMVVGVNMNGLVLSGTFR